MRVVILASGIGAANLGVGQYARQLLPRLAPRIKGAGHELAVLLSRDALVSLPVNGIKVVRLPAPRHWRNSRILLEHIYVPFVTLAADVCLSLTYLFPLTPVYARRKYLVVHNLSHVRHLACPSENPWEYSKARMIYCDLALRRTVSRVDGLIACSRFEADEIQALLRVPRERISMIPPGTDDECFRPCQDAKRAAEIRSRYGLPEHFYLFVDGEGPPKVKNFAFLAETYLSGRVQAEGMLPIAVASAKSSEELLGPTLPLVEKRRLTNKFHFLGYVPHRDLATLYSAARAFLYPSLYETFGFPLLEAMACGTPVVAANRSAIPEVVADAGLLFDPDRAESFVEALEKVNDDAIRKDLIAKGLRRAQSFSWERTARRVAELILR
jgi:glycosyltransferase involved in cell wall biosynthesis